MDTQPSKWLYDVDTIDVGYFRWLCDLVNVDVNTHSSLMLQLMNREFVWCMELDESRAKEGLELRAEYGIELDTPCSVLEALIGIAKRMDDMLMEDNTSSRISVWFWEMITNLGLAQYSDYRLLIEDDALAYNDDMYYIDSVLDAWMNREFDSDGSGSIFPLKNPMHDQRNRTIVYQLNDYILENYLEDYDE